MSPAEFNPMDPELEQAMQEIRDDSPDPAVVEAAAARVWARLAEAAASAPHEHIRGCADFQAMLPDYRAGRLPEARATAAQGPSARVRCLPQSVRRQGGRDARRAGPSAASITPSAGLPPRSWWPPPDSPSGWPSISSEATTAAPSFRPLNGTLYEVSAAGIRPLVAGQDLPDGVELRTAKDSDAMLQLHDGSVVELRERSGFSTTQTAQRSHHSPRPRQHHRAGRQAPPRPPLCRHRRLPRGRHRHGVQRQLRASRARAFR